MRISLLLSIMVLAPGTSWVCGRELPKAVGMAAALPFRLTDQQVRAAAANIDDAWEQVFHARWKHDSEMDRRYHLPVNPEAPLPPDASDEVFLRRATLDATGLIPTELETREFLNDPLPEKRHRLVERLLLSPGRGRQQFNRYADLFRLKDVIGGIPQTGYIALVRAAAEANVPFDLVIKDLLTASGTVADNPATGFLLRDQGDLVETMDELSWAFLRTDVHCALCHDHPFANTMQKQFYELASCFGATKVFLTKPDIRNPSAVELWPANATSVSRLPRDKRNGVLEIVDGFAFGLHLPDGYAYHDGKPGQLLKKAAALSFSKTDKTTWRKPNGLRQSFATWLVSSDRFVEVTAIKEWATIFGETRFSGARSEFGFQGGLSDEDYADNAHWRGSRSDKACSTTHPTYDVLGLDNYGNNDGLRNSLFESRLGKLLVALLRGVHFDLREYQRVLMHTRAYGRVSLSEVELGMDRFSLPPAPMLHRLSAEQAWDSLVSMGGIDPIDYRFASDLPQTLPSGHALRVLGRGKREVTEDSAPTISHSVARLMMNHDVVKRIMKPESALLVSVNGRFKNSPLQQAEALFLAILNRMPSERERAQAIGTISATVDGAGQVAWSLLNTSEFLFER